jgi:hypothetical protein
MLDEVADGSVVPDGQGRRVIAPRFAELACHTRALAEDRHEPRVDAGHFVAQLVCLAQGCVGHPKET